MLTRGRVYFQVKLNRALGNPQGTFLLDLLCAELRNVDGPATRVTKGSGNNELELTRRSYRSRIGKRMSRSKGITALPRIPSTKNLRNRVPLNHRLKDEVHAGTRSTSRSKSSDQHIRSCTGGRTHIQANSSRVAGTRSEGGRTAHANTERT